MERSSHNRLALILTYVAPIASLAVSPIWNYDPINLIKLLFIISAAFYCISIVLLNVIYRNFRIELPTSIAGGLFLLSMISTILFSNAPINQQIWGTYGRNTGFLTYFSFLAILLSASCVQKKDFYKTVVNSLVITSIPMTAYCLIQVAGRDPVGWSEKHPFGTLGNINFSSAFFGLSTICALALVREKKYSIWLRISLAVLIAIDLLIVLSTNSIQGIMMFIAGTGIQGFLYVRDKYNSRLIEFSYMLAGIFFTSLTLLGLSNKGPLAKFLFAPSIVFRTDYWHAGWEMTMKFPFFGVGLDSYGDWYRTLRGQISTLRTGPDRISNTAHNIFLDLSSNGGFPLLITYLVILVLAFMSGLKFLKNEKNPHAIGLFTSWIGFLIFSSISIAQVGVSIWGWLFTGVILGLNSNFDKNEKKNLNSKNSLGQKRKPTIKKNQISPSASLAGIIGLVIGFLLAYVPFQADIKYKSAIQTRALDKMIKSTETIGSTAFHQELVLSTASTNNFNDQAYEIAKRLVSEYPRDFFGWKAIYLVPNSSLQEKKDALKHLRELDPYNPELK